MRAQRNGIQIYRSASIHSQFSALERPYEEVLKTSCTWFCIKCKKVPKNTIGGSFPVPKDRSTHSHMPLQSTGIRLDFTFICKETARLPGVLHLVCLTCLLIGDVAICSAVFFYSGHTQKASIQGYIT